MWTDAARAIYRTDSRFYPSSMSDTEWKIIAPFLPSDDLPPIVDGLKRGHDRRWAMRSIVDTIFYVLRNGVPRQSLPKDFLPLEDDRLLLVQAVLPRGVVRADEPRPKQRFAGCHTDSALSVRD